MMDFWWVFVVSLHLLFVGNFMDPIEKREPAAKIIYRLVRLTFKPWLWKVNQLGILPLLMYAHTEHFQPVTPVYEKTLGKVMSWCLYHSHYCDVKMGAMASQIISLTFVYSTFIQAQIKENIKAPRHRPLCGEFIGDRWIPHTNGHLITSSWTKIYMTIWCQQAMVC